MLNEPEYMLLDIEKYGEYKLGKTHTAILRMMMMNCRNSRKYKGCIVEMTPLLKVEIKELLNCKHKQSYYNAMSYLLKSGIIKKLDVDLYLLNPEVFIMKGGKKSGK